jgi:hypothetical protein
MYSDMSRWISASSSPNMNSASALLSSVLPTPEGPTKMNEPIGRFGSFRPARARRMDLLIALIAASWLDDALVQLLLELQQAGGLLLLELLQRHARHLGDDLGDHLLVDLAVDLLGTRAPLGLHVLLLLLQLARLVAQLRRLLVVGVLDRFVLLDRQPLDVGLDLLRGSAACSSSGSARGRPPRRSRRSTCRAAPGP